MAKDFFLYQVGRVWYRLYWAFSLVCSAIIFAVYILAQFSTHISQYAATYSVGRTAFVMSCASLAYLLIIYWPIARYSLPFGSLVASMMLTVQLLNGLSNTTDPVANYIYVGLWLVSTFLVGSFGLPLLLGGTFVTFVFVMLHSNFQPAAVTDGAWVLLAGTIAITLGAYLFWKHRFVNAQEQEVDQLSGMLKTNQQQSVILIQSIADGVIVVDTEGKITLMNPAASEMTEWQINDAVGVDAQLVAKLSHENGEEIQPEDNPFAEVLKDQKHTTQTLLLTGKDGKTQTVSLVISPVLDTSNTLFGAVAVMRDISDERAAEKQRADFISTASHEMRTPVAAIEGYLALALNEKVSTIDTRARGYLEKAHTSTQHLGKLFQDLLTSSKAEDGRLSNHPQVVEMGAYLQQLTDDLKFAAEKKGLFVDFLVGSSNDAIDATNKDTVNTHVLKPLYYVFADPDRMREVITNLFDNACKYTEQGKISIGLTGDNDVVQLYVRDTGAGIPADDIPHLFQKFYRVDNSATRTIGGTGLGLFICRKIVELYKGRIWVESEIGKGSTFFINLPRLSIQRAESLQSEESKSTGAPTPSASAKA